MKAPHRILIVEDLPTDAKLMLRELQSAGYEPEWKRVDTERDFIAALDQGWDIILADYRLPQFDGLLALELLKARGLDIPFILVTATIGEDKAVEAMRAGARDYLIKDNLARLAPAVERELREAAERRKLREAEAALRASERKYRSLFESSRDAIVTLEPPDWRFRSGNPTAATMFGVKLEEELVSRGPWDVSPERQPDGRASAEKAVEMIETAMREGSHLFEWTHRRANGEEFRASVLLSKMLSERGGFLQATIRDITEIERTEGSRVLLATAVEQAAEVVMITDVNATIVYVNPAFQRVSGYTREEAIGQSPRILKSGKQDAEFYRRMWAALTAGREWSGHMINKRSDGTLYEEDSTISPVRDNAGNIINYVAVMHDVTERMVLEAQLRQAQKMDSVGQLAGGVAHDFNNLLTIIKGTAGVVLEELRAGDPLIADLEEIDRAADRAAALTQQLLAFSRKQVMQVQVLDLTSVVTNTVPMLQRLIGEDIDLVVTPTRGDDTVRADPGQLEQVLVNLVINARDAMPRGGQLTLEVRQVELDADCAHTHGHAVRPGSYVMLAVSDTGTGMDEATRGRIFEPFFTTKPVGRGTGLGLSTVYGIVKQSDGLVEVYSELGQGTTFKIYLPLMDGVAASVSAAIQVAPAHGSETLLVVEDLEGLCRLAKRMLESAGYTVLTAARGEEALFLLERHDVALVITDIVMPGMSGPTLAEECERLHPGMKVLFMSGYTDDVVVRHGVLENTVHFLSKPFTAVELTRAVRAALDSKGSDAPGGELHP